MSLPYENKVIDNDENDVDMFVNNMAVDNVENINNMNVDVIDNVEMDSNISNTLPDLPDIKLPDESIFTREFMFANTKRKHEIRKAYDEKHKNDTQETYQRLHKWLCIKSDVKSMVIKMILNHLRNYSYIKPVHVIKFHYNQPFITTTMYSLVNLYPSLMQILKEYIVFSTNILEVIHTEYPVQTILTAIFNDYYSRRGYTNLMCFESYDIGETIYEWYFTSNCYKRVHLLKNLNLIPVNMLTIGNKYCVDMNDVNLCEIKK